MYSGFFIYIITAVAVLSSVLLLLLHFFQLLLPFGGSGRLISVLFDLGVNFLFIDEELLDHELLQ